LFIIIISVNTELEGIVCSIVHRERAHM